MKEKSLTRILVSNWDEINNDLSNGSLLSDIFCKLEERHGFERTYSTWHTTYSRILNRVKKDSIVQYKNKLPTKKNDPPVKKSNQWNANSGDGENPILAALKAKEN